MNLEFLSYCMHVVDNVYFCNKNTRVECLRKRNSQIRFHKKYVGPRNIVEFHKMKVTNSTNYSHPHFFSTGQIFVENRFRLRKSTSASDFTNKIRTFFCEILICEFRFRKHSSRYFSESSKTT